MRYNIYASMLKMHDTFRPASEPVTLACDMTAPELTVLREQYGLAAIAGEGDAFPRAMRVMEWLTGHVRHNGSFNFDKGHLALAVLEFAFDQPDKGVNCTTLAQTLSSCLLSLGIPARPVGIYPFAPYDGDNHFVTEVWCEELGQWVMLDPTVNACVMDSEGRPLDCLGVRALLADQAEHRFSEGLRYNGTPYEAREHTEYLAKDLFALQYAVKIGYDCSHSAWRWVCPEGFDIQKRQVLNVEWRMRQWGSSEWMEQWLTNVKAATFRYAAPEDVRKAPVRWPQTKEAPCP